MWQDTHCRCIRHSLESNLALLLWMERSPAVCSMVEHQVLTRTSAMTLSGNIQGYVAIQSIYHSILDHCYNSVFRCHHRTHAITLSALYWNISLEHLSNGFYCSTNEMTTFTQTVPYIKSSVLCFLRFLQFIIKIIVLIYIFIRYACINFL